MWGQFRAPASAQRRGGGVFGWAEVCDVAASRGDHV